MYSLQVLIWIRFLAWLDIGLLIYYFYGRTYCRISVVCCALSNPSRRSRLIPNSMCWGVNYSAILSLPIL
jgi:hypothetical protein